MAVKSLLGELRSKGVKIKVNDDRLTLDAPKGTLDDGLVAQIREHKAELLALLNSRLPRHAGGFPVTDTEHPCAVCGCTEWQQHVTYKYCLTCGRESGPGAVTNEREETTHE